MKIAYFAWIDTSQESGVLKKIVNQISTWERRGITTKLFALSPSLLVCECLKNVQVEVVQCDRVRFGYIKGWLAFSRISKWNPDVIYLRFLTYFPFMISLMKRIPTFLEIVTNDLAEFKVQYSRVLYIIHKFTRDSVFQSAAGMIFLTPETSRYFVKYNKPIKIIGDSIDFSQYSEYEPPSNEVPHLIFMGLRLLPWFGIDKILSLAKYFPKWRFDLIGFSESDIKDKLPANVVVHGVLTKHQYEKIIRTADIGIGTLALHRIHMNETTPLKVREYLAFGLPIIIGYNDPDLLDNPPYVLALPNREDNVQSNLDNIRKFVETWKGKRVHRKHIFQLGVDVKENQRLEFIMANGKGDNPSPGKT